MQKDDLDKLNKINKDIEILKKQAAIDGRKIIKAACQEFLNKYPEVKSISWEQYTPSYNDGSPCYFRYYGLEDSNSIELKDTNIDTDEFIKTPKGIEIWDSLCDIDNILSAIDDGLKDIFGEGQIIISLDESDSSSLKVEVSGIRD